MDWIHSPDEAGGRGGIASTAADAVVQKDGLCAAEELARRPGPPHLVETPSLQPARRRGSLGRALDKFVEFFLAWNQCRRDRRLLGSLDERMLRDMGVDGSSAKNDSTSSFWRLRSGL